MYRKSCDRHKKPRTRMTIRRVNGADKSSNRSTPFFTFPGLPRGKGADLNDGLNGQDRLNGLNVLNPDCEAQRAPAKITASSSGGTTSSWAYVQSLGFLSVRHLRNCAV